MSRVLAPSDTIGLPAGALRALRRAAAASGSQPSVLLRHLGAACGKELAEGLRGHLAARGVAADPAALELERFWQALSDYLGELGWGELEVEQPHPAVVSLSSSSWLEADPEGGARHPACHFTTGVLSALFSEVAGAEVAALEVECRTSGGERCVWLAGGMDALGAVYDAMRDGRDPLEALHEAG
jgi:predicted hydrocarbon binding protein